MWKRIKCFLFGHVLSFIEAELAMAGTRTRYLFVCDRCKKQVVIK